MNTLDNKLEEIIANSGLHFCKTEIENEIDIKSKIVGLKDVMQNIWNDLPQDANIAIYGLGYNFDELLDSIDLSSKNVVCMIDRRPELTVFKGYPVIRVEELPKYNVNLVLITPRFYYDEIEENVKNASAKCKVIDLVKEFTRGSYYINYSDVYLGNMTEEDYLSVLSLNKAVRNYYNSYDYRYLLYVINGYLEFRDIKTALFYIGVYVNSSFPDIDKVLYLQNGLLGLLKEIRRKSAHNTSQHCLVFVSDNVTNNSINAENTPFLYKCAESNIHCVNAYTHIGWTSTSFLTIFKQKSFIDNHLYGDPFLSGDEHFFNCLSTDKADTFFYGAYSKSVLNNINNFYSCGKGCADMMWQYLCAAYENDNKTVCFFHFSETHVPYLSLDYVDISSISDGLSLYYHSLKYVDSQIEYLLDLLPDSTKFLFSSDHGHGYPEYSNAHCNVPYVICDRITHCGTDKRLVSHLDTLDIVLNLLNNRAAFDNIPTKPFVEVNGEFYYSRTPLEAVKKSNMHDGRAFKCFISETDKYVVFYDGEEMYFLLPDDSKNLIDDSKYTDRINWFRANVNTEFPDWSDDNGRYDVTREYIDINKRITK